MSLYNKVNSKLLKEQLLRSRRARKTCSFYKYHIINDLQSFRDRLYKGLDQLEVWGRIYISREGVNAQISIPANTFTDVKKYIYTVPFLKGVRINEAIEDTGKSFFKLKILIREKIVADGLDGYAFDVGGSATHLDALSFNRLTDRPETLIVDMRNHYESEVGHFQNAICPDVDTFRMALPLVKKLLKGKEDQNIVMYCTGGIRCEKASAWFKDLGFKHVFQLDGGIIEYVRQVKKLGIENKFIGKNFVFDERLGERVTPTVISYCHQCGQSSDAHTNCKNDACHLLFIQCEKCSRQFQGCCSTHCQDILALPEEVQKKLRRGVNKGRQVFKKGRANHLQRKILSQK